MPNVTLHTTDITSFIDDFIKYDTQKEVAWFMRKYHITYEEYSYLSFAAVSARAYKVMAKTINKRLARLIMDVGAEVQQLMSYIEKRGDTEMLGRISANLISAIENAKKPYSDDYMNDFVKGLNYNEH